MAAVLVRDFLHKLLENEFLYLQLFLQFSKVSSIILREINIEAGLYSVKS